MIPVLVYYRMVKRMPDICPICFKRANYTTVCKHTFCKKCLYRWSGTCPLCRRSLVLEYPNTRAMSTKEMVWTHIKILLSNVRRTHRTIDKLRLAEKLLNYIWDNRVLIRKHGRLCKIIRRKSSGLERECARFGLPPPKITRKMLIL